MSLFTWKFRNTESTNATTISSPVSGNVEHYGWNATIGKNQYRILKKAAEKLRLSQMTQIEYLRSLLINDPSQFLQVMAEINPFFKNVIGIVCQLAIGDGKFRYEVIDEVNNTVSEEEAKELEAWLNSFELTTGKLPQIVEKLLCELMFFSDGIAAEGLFDKSDKFGKFGYKKVKLFPASQVRIAVDDQNEESLVQWQTSGKWVILNKFHVFWKPNDARLGSASGTYSMSAALIEMFGDLLLTTSLRDGVRSAGQPIRIFTYDKDAIVKRLIEIFKFLPTSQAFKDTLAKEKKAIEDEAAIAKQTEYIVAEKNVSVSHLDPANFQNVVPAIEVLNTRLAAALRTHRTVIGFGDKQTRNTLDYQLTAGYVEWKRGETLSFLEEIAEQHFLFTGRKREIRIIPPKIHLNDSLIEENTKQLHFFNILCQYAMGFISKEEFSKEISGHDPHGTEIPGAIDALLKVSKGDGNNSRNSASSGGQGGNPGTK